MSRGPRHIYRHASAETLTSLFSAAGAANAVFDADLTPAARATRANQAFLAQPAGVRAKLQVAFSEIGALASDLGEDCIRQAAGLARGAINVRFAALRSSYDRVAWVRGAHAEIFHAALAAWFFERRSTSRLADAFAAPEEIKIAENLVALEARITAIIAEDIGEAPRVKVECYSIEDGAVLVAVSHEELWSTDSEFTEEGELDARAHRVVHSAGVKIERGMITVAADRGGAARRRALCDAVATEMLGLSGELARLPPLEYNLQRLLDAAPFQTDPAHMITDVLVTALKVSSPSLADAFDEIYTSGRRATDVRERVLRRTPVSDRPFTVVLAGELRVVFGPGQGRTKQRTVRINFSGPTGCKAQLDCAEEALVRSRYLKLWGLIAPQRQLAR